MVRTSDWQTKHKIFTPDALLTYTFIIIFYQITTFWIYTCWKHDKSVLTPTTTLQRISSSDIQQLDIFCVEKGSKAKWTMGVFTQLGLLLKQNLIERKRRWVRLWLVPLISIILLPIRLERKHSKLSYATYCWAVVDRKKTLLSGLNFVRLI